jgi:hypothetical protein
MPDPSLRSGVRAIHGWSSLASPAWAIAIASTTGCHLDLSSKTSCATDADCVDGNSCIDFVCIRSDGSVSPGDASTAEPDAGGQSGGESGGSCSTAPSIPFPSTPVLDTFGDASSLSSWIGLHQDSYGIADGTLVDTLDASAPSSALLWHSPFVANQEVYATFAAFDPNVYRIALLLAVQNPTRPTNEQPDGVYVYYSGRGLLGVGTRESMSGAPSGTWGVTLQPGHTVGARMSAGCVSVYVDGQLLGSVDVSNAQTLLDGGYIGVYSEVSGGGQPSAWGDFGGGNGPR